MWHSVYGRGLYVSWTNNYKVADVEPIRLQQLIDMSYISLGFEALGEKNEIKFRSCPFAEGLTRGIMAQFVRAS